GTVRAHHDDEGLAPRFPVSLHESEPIQAGHADVAENHVGRLRPGNAQPLLSVTRREDGAALVLEDHLEGVTQPGLVIDDEHPCVAHAATSSTGSQTENDAPLPGSVDTSTFPPISATVPATIASPRPVPSPGSFVVKKGSKMAPRCSSGMPGP